MINKAPLMMVPGGLLMHVDIFKLFLRQHPEFKNWQTVQKGFLSLRLHRLASDGTVNWRFEQHHNQHIHTGILFSHYAVALPTHLNLYNLNTGKVRPISAVELIHWGQQVNFFTPHQQATKKMPALQSLTAAGQWEVIKKPENTLLKPKQGLQTRG